jgi:glycosyltransferase involved in cell wall biosynthesis
VPYGINVERFTSADPEQVKTIREQYRTPLLIAVGRLVYYKGFEYLIEAMQQVNARLLLIGDGPLSESLRAHAVRCGVAEKVFFLGELQNQAVIPYYHASEVFVLPSIARSEAFGIVQIEAMAAGTPVINTQLDSGVPFVSPDGVTGLTVPPCNPGALANAINQLLGNEQQREALGAAGVQRARREFSLEQMIARTLEVYRRVLLVARRSAAVSA